MLPTFRHSISSSVTTTATLSLPHYHRHFSTTFKTPITNHNPTTTLLNPSRNITMSTSSTSTNTSSQFSTTACHPIPGLSTGEIDRIADQTLERYSYSSQRKGKGLSIVWFRNDLRILDNEALFKAWLSSASLLPVYCFDPRLFSTTHSFGFPKTGALRANFLIECVADLKKNLMKRGLNLLIQHGKPEDILPSLVKTYGAHTVYAHKETCSEEINVERLVEGNLRRVTPSSIEGISSNPTVKLELIWGSTMYHMDDLPFQFARLPDVYTQFRKAVESKSKIRGCIKIPTLLGPAPSIREWGHVPAISQLGLNEEKVSKGLKFTGGESAALTRVHEYFWNKARELLRLMISLV